MKKLLILTALVTLTSSSVGCRACRWLWRGAEYDPCPPVVAPMCAPVCPAPTTCDPCTGAVVEPGPANYAPAITQ